VFVENRLRHLVASGEAVSEVIAPVPWFPFAHPWFGDWAVNARVAVRRSRHGLNILHPRFPVIPKIGMSMAPALLYRAMVPVVGRLIADGHRYDAIDAHYVYPDGVAAVRLGQRFGLPVVVTARGTDVSLIPQFVAAQTDDPAGDRRRGGVDRRQRGAERGSGGDWRTRDESHGVAQWRRYRLVLSARGSRCRTCRAGCDAFAA
jgi:hypothetical protein